jgi:predicted RNA-binding Zn-ribbon protein involved in translation (DUF1610 family)
MVGGNVFRLDITVHRIREGFDASPDRRPSRLLEAPVPVLAASGDLAIESVARFGSQPCPSCHVAMAHRSKARNLYERFRKVRTHKRLFRCEKCSWRGWVTPLEFGRPAEMPHAAMPDLGALDTAATVEAFAATSFSPGDLK